MNINIGPIQASEYAITGQMMVDIYAQLSGFPSPQEQPKYYRMLANIGSLHQAQQSQVLVAREPSGEVLGAVVFIEDIQYYGAAGFNLTGLNSTLDHACGIRLLGVNPQQRGLGLGKALTQACLAQARILGRQTVILHTTAAMQVAWQMYQTIGFQRDPSLDFTQGELPVFGFHLRLNERIEMKAQ